MPVLLTPPYDLYPSFTNLVIAVSHPLSSNRGEAGGMKREHPLDSNHGKIALSDRG